MLSYILSEDRDEVFATSLIRMVPVLIAGIKDSSFLVRAAAAQALQSAPTKEALQA